MWEEERKRQMINQMYSWDHLGEPLTLSVCDRMIVWAEQRKGEFLKRTN